MKIKELKEMVKNLPDEQELELYLENKGDGWQGEHPTRNDESYSYWDFIDYKTYRSFKLIVIGIK